jgi:hypothetical protein
MVQGWATEEVIEFTVDYMDLQAIDKPISRHEGRLSGKGTRGHTTFNVNYVTYTQAYFTVLQQFVPVAPYVIMHVQMLQSCNSKKFKDWIAREHRNNFGSWLRLQIMDQDAGVQLVDINKCYDLVIRRSPKTGLQGNTETILIVGYIFKLWIRMQVFN